MTQKQPRKPWKTLAQLSNSRNRFDMHGRLVRLGCNLAICGALLGSCSSSEEESHRSPETAPAANVSASDEVPANMAFLPSNERVSYCRESTMAFFMLNFSDEMEREDVILGNSANSRIITAAAEDLALRGCTKLSEQLQPGELGMPSITLDTTDCQGYMGRAAAQLTGRFLTTESNGLPTPVETSVFERVLYEEVPLGASNGPATCTNDR